MEFVHTSLPEETRYPKLVRDNIPRIIKERTGKDAELRKAGNDEEYLEFLVAKLGEEAAEARNGLKAGNLIEEMADVQEVILAILEAKGWSLGELERVRLAKRGKNGGFNEKIILLKNPD